MEIRSYRDLQAWQSGMELVEMCYAAARRFPSYENFALSSQLRRAVVSVPANIAEGRGRQHTAEFLNFLSIAYGSLMEVETHVQIAQRLGYIEEAELDSLLAKCGETGRLLNGLMGSLRSRLNS